MSLPANPRWFEFQSIHLKSLDSIAINGDVALRKTLLLKEVICVTKVDSSHVLHEDINIVPSVFNAFQGNVLYAANNFGI